MKPFFELINDIAIKHMQDLEPLHVAVLEDRGFEVLDLGVNVSPEQFIAAVKEKNANIVAMSAPLTTTMPSMKTTIDAFKQVGVRDQVKVLIGGAPITQRYAEEIGADRCGESAAGAVAIAREALAGKEHCSK